MNDEEIALLGEQLRHALDLLRADHQVLRRALQHESEFVSHRLTQIEKRLEDQEARLRSATDGVSQFKMFSGLASGGSAILAVFAFVRSLFFVP
ncbi:MAG: hypothetical protein HPY45_14790 [Anaerolineae bacterium]|nr:hypothetical protein [Anaerolineae bacterium]